MAGPISTAFVNIVARLQMDRAKGDLRSELRGTIAGLEDDLSKLEGAAYRTGRVVAQQLGDLRVNLDAGDALKDMTRVEGAAEQASSSLRELQDRKIGLDSKSAVRDINRLEELLNQLARSVQVVDGEHIEINVASARTQLQSLESAASRLEEQLNEIKRPSVKPQVASARADLERLRQFVDRVLTALARVDRSRVRVHVDDLQLDQVRAQLNALEGRVIDIKMRADSTGWNRVSKGVERLNVNLNDFGDQFRNIAFRAVSYLAVGQAIAGLGRIIRMGIEAAGEIQTVTVGLNRLFTDMPQLGMSASRFIGELRKVAIETPFEFIGLADTSRRLVQLGGDAEDALDRMMMLADAGAAVGATSEDINGVVRALSQMSAKGRVNMQDLNQIAERLPNFQRRLQLQGVIAELEAIGHPAAATVSSFEDIRDAGIEIETVIAGIFRGMSMIPGAAGAAAAQARTLQGSFQKISDFMQIEFAQSFAGVGGLLADELNAAADGAFDAIDERGSQLAEGISDVLTAFGLAAERALPGIFDAITESADEVADLATALGEIVRSLSTGLSADFARGLVDGLTNVLNVATLLNDLLGSILPQGVTQGLGEVAAELIVLTRIFGPGVIAPFQNFVNDIIFSISEVRGGAVTASEALANIGPSAAKAGIAAAGLVALNIYLDQVATRARRLREVREAVDQAVTALSELNDVGEALDEWLLNFTRAGEGINLGDLERMFDGITSPELLRRLDVTRDELERLMSAVVEFGVTTGGVKDWALWPAGLRDELRKMPSDVRAVQELLEELNMTDIDSNLLVNLVALSEQFNEAAQEAYTVGLFTGKWGLVAEETAAKVNELVEASGNYMWAVHAMNEAQQAAAREGAFELAQSMRLTDPEFRAIIRNFTDAKDGTVDWDGVLGSLHESLMAVDDALLDLNDKFPDLMKMIDRFGTADRGNVEGLRRLATEFSLVVAELSLSEEEFDALARRVGTTLSGAELAAEVEAIADAAEELSGSFEQVILGLSDLELEAEGFSLDKLIEELSRIAEARANVVENIHTLLDEFGNLGLQAIQGMIEAQLDPEVFAIAVEQMLSQGRPKLEEIVELFGEIGSESATELVNRMVSMGLTEEQARNILGLNELETAANDLSSVANQVDSAIASISDAFSGRGPLTKKGAEASTEFRFPILFQQETDELARAVERAAQDGASVGEEYGRSIVEAAGTSSKALSPAIAANIIAASRLNAALARFNGLALGYEFGTAVARGAGNSRLLARVAGTEVGFALGQGLAQGIALAESVAVANAVVLIERIIKTIRLVAGIRSPSRVFAGLGRSLGDGLAQGIKESIPTIVSAAHSAFEAAAAATMVSPGRGEVLSPSTARVLSGDGGIFREVFREVEGRSQSSGPGQVGGNKTYEITQIFNEKVSPKHMAAELVWKL